jgi:hypothetical protein
VIDKDQFLRRVLEEVGRDDLRRVRFLIGSATLRKAVQLIVDVSKAEGRLFIPHYWAEFYHDGHGGFGPSQARKLVFFARREDDPRAPTPERAAQLRRLTENEYRRGLQINAERRANGQSPFMYVLDRVGPSQGKPFFDELAQGSADRHGARITRAFDDAMQEFVDTDPALRPEQRSARFRLG